MPSLPSVKGHEALRALLKGGFYIHHQKGSHARLFHKDKAELRVTIPIHNKDLPEKTLRRILKQADLMEEEFLTLLKD
jgi:predicted RNA binding protein YcfA (HicA-like mRNA interferase family)